MTKAPKPPLHIRLRVLCAIDYVPGTTIRERIKHVAEQTFYDQDTSITYQFTWRTVSTWLYRHKISGITTLENKTRADKNLPRKVQVSQLAEAIHEVMPHLSRNKNNIIPKSVLYRVLLEKGYFQRSQLAPTTFYRLIREHQLLDETVTQKLRQSFAMLFANQLWQADTMHGVRHEVA